MISVLVWNVRGVGSISTVRRLRKLAQMHSVSLIILQEPLVSSTSAPDVCTRFGFDNYACSDNNKLWMFWRHNLSI